MNIREELNRRISCALAAAGAGDAPAIVAPSAKPQFGDYQANGCMAAAKKMKTNPRELAEKVLEHLDLSDLAEKVEIAGPGFINIFLSELWLAKRLSEIASDERLGAARGAGPATARRVVVDYSSPNLAKEMHVGHLRSTIIGDALARVLEFLGDTVIRQNHVGDWGTQFGMLTAYMERLAAQEEDDSVLADLEEFYREAKQLFDTNADFANRSRECVVKLQSGESSIRNQWEYFLDQSLKHCEWVYKCLGVLLKRDDVRGESAYNDDLPGVVADLDAAGLLEESEGAKGVFLDEFRNKEDERAFVIVQKSDGGYLYASTDLAAMRYRAGELQADRILYVTDSRQAQHFAQVFLIARKAGFVGDNVSLEHVPFGLMLGTDGRPFKTRTGGTVKLMDLLDEAVKQAGQLVRQKNPHLPDDQCEEIARVVGIGAMKYADLSQNRMSDYVFSWEKMLSLEGNTAPYMQYAYARIRSIFRKAGDAAECGEILVHEPAERGLGVKLAQFAETIETVAETCQPHLLCAYLYELAGAFMGFYESCPVLKADGPARASRLALCDLTARVIKEGLNLLGIKTIEQM